MGGELTELQQTAFELCLTGHNLILTGQCGTGKTYLMRCIIQYLKRTKNVAVTSTTGMASNVLGLGCTTVHHWSGLGDGRYSEEELVQLYMHEDRYADARKRVLDAEVLVIDEMGMLSETIFDKLEFICRLARNNNQVFGGLQVIASGDFKQLPPVPNYRYHDPGNYCFKSKIFKTAFPHHVNLTEVLRQHETHLVRAINQLCDGSPDEETELFLKSLDRPLENEDEAVRLLGTKFDTTYINEIHLEKADGPLKIFRAHDEGKTSLLHQIDAEKVLALKVGVPVIMVRNTSGGLLNGMRGTIHSIQDGKDPVVNFQGQLQSIPVVRFDIYDPDLKTVLATRTQYPLKLAYGLTVHRAQGQTIANLDIDCFSFFAPGQMGVAVGRAISSSCIRVRNYNANAAHLKHPQVVYDFYKQKSQRPEKDNSCCRIITIRSNVTPPTPNNTTRKLAPTVDKQTHNSRSKPGQFSEIQCPWQVSDFLKEHKGQSFLPENLTPDFMNTMSEHSQYLYRHVISMFTKNTKSNDDFVNMYKNVNRFLTSDEHISTCRDLGPSSKPQKLSSKLCMWLLNKEISSSADKIIHQQEDKFVKSCKESTESGTHEHDSFSSSQTLSSAALSKIRYIAGACIHRILKRLRAVVMRKMGKNSNNSKAERDWYYRMHKILKSLRLSEEDALKSTSIENSMFEIDFKQGPSRGLLHISDKVFTFFVNLNNSLQKLLSVSAFHLYADNIHLKCRELIFCDPNLVKEWKDLFHDTSAGLTDNHSSTDDETLQSLLTELYELVTEHFIRIAIVEGVHIFKSTVPRKKKQALRSKVSALGDREISAKRKKTLLDIDAGKFSCPVCIKECLDEPKDENENSIACDSCNNWFHFKCVNLKGSEYFLKNDSCWKCANCTKIKSRNTKSK